MDLSASHILPSDYDGACLAGRVWRPDLGGPAVVALRDGEVFDITPDVPTVSGLCDEADPGDALRQAQGESLGEIAAILRNSAADGRDLARAWFLAPIDLQAVKAAGVTFAVSMLERVIEERARGNPDAAQAIRSEIVGMVGEDFAKLKPGSPEAQLLKARLVEEGVWSQYLEVGIGPDAEIFTKAQPMSSVGVGADIGILPTSSWNNPEPEVVLAVSSEGRIVGATLGNDVNLRDVEGRSALLLSKAKDNNASCAIGPFLRLFDDTFSLDDVRSMDVTLRVDGAGGYQLHGASSITRISRDPADLVAQMIGPHHAYPDGAVLFLGTLFAPVEDRDVEGQGFTHHQDDIVTISAPQLGALVNRVRHTDRCDRWSFGTRALMQHLARRGNLSSFRLPSSA